MSAMIRFTVHGEARPKGSAKAFLPKGWTRPIITSDNKNLRAWEDTIRAELQRVMSETPGDVLTALYDAPIAITMLFHLPRPKSLPAKVLKPTKKPDLDKLARGAIDALNGVLFKDDAQVVMIQAWKRYAAAAPCVEILVELAAVIVCRPAATSHATPETLFDFREEPTA